MVSSATLIHDATLFFRDLLEGVSDPLTNRSTINPKSAFILSSYPDRPVLYPVITVVCDNSSGKRLGMNTEEMMFSLSFEIRVWARNQKEKDQLADAVIDKLRTSQNEASTGTIANNLVHLSVDSATNVDEEGEGGIKSKIIGVTYEYYTN